MDDNRWYSVQFQRVHTKEESKKQKKDSIFSVATLLDGEEQIWFTVLVRADNDVWAEERAWEWLDDNMDGEWRLSNVHRVTEYDYVLF